MRKKLKRIIKLSIIALLVVAGIYVGPKVTAVLRLKRIAQSYVDSSNASTFRETKTTLVYDKNDNELCKIKNDKDMYYVSFDKIPQTLTDAFIVMEDKEFYEHSGVDYKAIIRATLENQKNGEIVQGASTITQQLARNIFLSKEVTWERKIEEMFIASDLEKKYSKDQILEFYLNNIYFGNGYYGVQSAAKGYFNKDVSELTLSEQAFIAAIPNGPTRYNPYTNLDNTLKRRNMILDQLYSADYISSMNHYMAVNEDVELCDVRDTELNNSVVTYIRHCATESLMEAEGFVFRCNFETEDDYDSYMQLYDTYFSQCQQKLVAGGYTVYTSIDPELQEKLQNAVDTNLASYTEKSDEGVYTMQGAATCIDNDTGNVAAIVGGRSQDEIGGLTLNRAYQSYRQSGSSIKPLSVYTPFLQLGNTADTIVKDEPIKNGPVNADGTYEGEMTVREAVEKSKNTVAWNIYQQITPRSGISFLIQMGYKKVWVDKDYNAGALGGFTYGVTAEEMAGGFATIENDGFYRKPTCVRYIQDSSGKTIKDESNRGSKVYEQEAARKMSDILVSVVEEGTGGAAAVDGVQIAGKTGSTNSGKDMWFCGYSPDYTLAVWTGYDMPQAMTGSNRATYIFHDFMETAGRTSTGKIFSKPSQVNKTPSDENSTIEDINNQTTSEESTKNQMPSQESMENQIPSQESMENQIPSERSTENQMEETKSAAEKNNETHSTEKNTKPTGNKQTESATVNPLLDQDADIRGLGDQDAY